MTTRRGLVGVVSYDGLTSTPILDTKLHVPLPRPNAVLRPYLIERLNEGLRSRLILVSAPAGFGKTTIVSDWVAGCSRLEPAVRPAWLSLDEGDGDLVRFLGHLAAALRTVAADVGRGVMAMLQTPQPPPVESVLVTLLNEIRTLPYDVVVVLDDYHVVDSVPVDGALTFLLGHRPPQMHLVIVTREDPRLPLARWRAQGQLTELRAADLRFTPSEVTDFLNQTMDLDLAAEDITALGARTEGWIAGLQLSALSLKGRSDATSFIQSFTGSHRFVLDYLVEEVLQRQPERVRNFLLQTSMLDELFGPLCDAVTGQQRGKEMLERLEHDNLFVVPLDDVRQWYRYHHLFRDVLQARLFYEQPDRLPVLHRRASEWFEGSGSCSDAIRHALAGEDFARAAELIERAGLLTEDSSQAATWLGWVRALPDEMIRSRPVLSAWYACALLGIGELEAAEARLKDAERWLEPGRGAQPIVADEEQLRTLLATISVVRAYHAQSVGDVPGTLEHAQRVFEILPEGGHFRYEQATGLVGLTHLARGDLQAADRIFADYAKRLLAAGNIPDAIGATSLLADIRPALGRLREARDALTQLLQVVADQGEPMPPVTAELYRGLGELDLERGDVAAATHHLQKSQELGEQAELPVWRYRWRVARARLSGTEGDLEGALALLDAAQRLFIRTPSPDVRPIAALKARIWARQGRVTEALDWARERGLSVDDDLSYPSEFEHLTLASVLVGRYEGGRRVDRAVHGAVGLLERLLRTAEQGDRLGSVIEILAVQALAHDTLGDTSTALASLERALSLGEPEGYVRVFVNEGPPMVRLLEEAASRKVAPASARRVLGAFRSASPGRSQASAARLAGYEPLSKREIEVLQYIAAGFTNQEIADRLYRSLYTIKAHARSIYDKLDAHSRTQAAARARELGIPPLP